MLSILRCCGNRIQAMSLTKITCRRFMKISDKMEMMLKKADYVPYDYQLVYRHKNYRGAGLMYHSLHFMTCATLVTVLYQWYTQVPRDASLEEIAKFIENPFQAATVTVFTIFILVIAQVTRHRYPLRIYYHEKTKTYRAIFIGKVPFTMESYDFPQECLTYVAKDSVLPWRNPLFNANGRKIILYNDKFRTYSDFYQMLKPEEL